MGTQSSLCPPEPAHQDGHNIVGVYTQPDKPKEPWHEAYPPPVKVVAQANHLPVFQPKT